MRMLRAYFSLAILCITISSFASLPVDPTCMSHSVFVPRSITHDPTYELALANYDFYHPQSPEDCDIFDLFLTPFYQRSFNGDKKAGYFLPNGKESIVFAQNGLGDVDPLWLDLVAGPGLDYHSIISVAPRRTVYGVNVVLFKDLSYWADGAWANITFTPMHAKHDLRLAECDATGGPGIVPGIANGIDALNNPALLFGKYNRCAMGKTGNDDIQIKLGYNRFCDDGSGHKGVYLVGSIPTGNKPCPDYIFSPRIGTRAGAFGFGINTDHELYSCERHTTNFMFDLKYRYIFGAWECRSFDLCANGQWSRFLQTVDSDQRSLSMPGINNCFTRSVKATPRSEINLWAALHTLRCNDWHYEIGYNLWWRQSEDIRFGNCDCCAQGIYDIAANAGRQNAQNQQIRQPISASTANISQGIVPPNDAKSDLLFTQVGNLNAASGAHPRCISNKFYAASAYECIVMDEPMSFGLGASIEAAVGKTSFNYWAIWGKWGMNF